MREWKSTGARKINCYYQDNFAVDNDGLVSAPLLHDHRHSNELRAHAFLVGGSIDSSAPPQLFGHSLQWLERPLRWTLLHYHSVGGAGHLDLLHTEEHASEVAAQILRFDQRANRVHFSLWGALQPPPEVTSSKEQVGRSELVVPSCVVATATMVSFGLSLELYIGPSLMAMREGRSYFRMAQMTVGFSTSITGMALVLCIKPTSTPRPPQNQKETKTKYE